MIDESNKRDAFPAGTSPWGTYLRDTAGPSLLSQEELDAALELTPVNGRFLELGTWCGASVSYWARRRPEVEFLSVDLMLHHPLALAMWQANRVPNMQLFVGPSASFWGLCKNWWDVILIDCSHEEADVYQDCKSALEASNLVLVHDYGEPDFPGVKNAVDAILGDHASYELVKIVGSLVAVRPR